MVARDEGGVRGSVGGPRGNDLESECGSGKSGKMILKNEYAHIRKQLLTLSSSKMSFVPKLARLGKERGEGREGGVVALRPKKGSVLTFSYIQDCDG